MNSNKFGLFTLGLSPANRWKCYEYIASKKGGSLQDIILMAYVMMLMEQIPEEVTRTFPNVDRDTVAFKHTYP